MEKPQTFRSPTALVVWVVWLLFAVGNWVDLAVQGRDKTSVVAAAILLLGTGIAYVTAQRPRVIVDDAGVTIKNPVRDHAISWAAVTDVDLADLLRVHCTLDPAQTQDPGDGRADGKRQDRRKRKVISAWAIHYSRRRQLSAETKARRSAARTAGGARPSLFGGFATASRSMSYGAPAAASSTSSSEADAKMIVRLINERATTAHAEALWTATPASPPPPLTVPPPPTSPPTSPPPAAPSSSPAPGATAPSPP